MDHNVRSMKLARLIKTAKSQYADFQMALFNFVKSQGELESPVISAASLAISDFNAHSAGWWQTALKVEGKVDSDLPWISFSSIMIGQEAREFFRIEKIAPDETIPEVGNVDVASGDARAAMARAGENTPSNLGMISYASYAWFKRRDFHAVKVVTGSNPSKWSAVFKAGDEYFKLSFDHSVFKADQKAMEKYLKE